MKTKEEILREQVDQYSKEMNLPPTDENTWNRILADENTIVCFELMDTFDQQFKEKAAQWDKLYAAVEGKYYDSEGNYLEDEGGDLTDIGEIAATHLGFL
jgi:hypothetical protein